MSAGCLPATGPPTAADTLPTWFINSDDPAVRQYAERVAAGATDQVDLALKLFYAVRDDIRYTAYGLRMEREHFRASNVLAEGKGWCVTKACLLAAVSRAMGLPCRLGYANVRNHLATEKLLARMGTDIFYYHGYNEFWLEGRWVKATVAFNRSLCEKARLAPLDFDGRTDSLYHPFDLDGRRHMEYLHEYGSFSDLPYEAILTKFAEVYPLMLWDGQAADSQRALESLLAGRADERATASALEGDFEAEIAAETAAKLARKKS